MLATGWKRGDRSRDLDGLAQFWVHSKGYAIYQGRIKRHFLYRLVRPDGATQDFERLRDAKEQAQ